MKIANATARLGEDIACKFLKKQGFKIIERNFRKGYGEIDIISVDPSIDKEDVLVFVEVKTRKSNEFGDPFEAITPWKLRTIIKTSQFYKLSHPGLPESLRIDAISVKLSSSQMVLGIEHIKNISGF